MTERVSEETLKGAEEVSETAPAEESGSGFRDPPPTRTLDDIDEFGTAETPPPRELTLLDDLDVGWDVAGKKIIEAVGEHALTVQVYRLSGFYADGTATPHDEYCDEGPPSQMRLSLIKERYGGGSFRIKILDRSRKYVKRFTLHIHGAARPVTTTTAERTREQSAAPTLDQDLARLAKLQNIIGGGKSEGEGSLTGQIAQLRELRETYENLEDLFGSEAEEPAGDTVSEQAQIRIATKLIDLGERWLENKMDKKTASGEERETKTVTTAAPDAPPASSPASKDEGGRLPAEAGMKDEGKIPELIESVGSSILTAFHAGLEARAVAAEIVKKVPPGNVADLHAFVRTFKEGDEVGLRDRALAGAGAKQAGRAKFKKPGGALWVRGIIQELEAAWLATWK